MVVQKVGEVHPLSENDFHFFLQYLYLIQSFSSKTFLPYCIQLHACSFFFSISLLSD